MEYRIQETCESIDWDQVRGILKAVDMGYYEPERHRQAFENSFAVVFVFRDEQLVGFGRAISDGAYQAAIYDVAVTPECQGQGVGKLIMGQLLQKLAHCHIILYASPGKEGFYAKEGFALLKTGMARFLNPAQMQARGVIEGLS